MTKTRPDLIVVGALAGAHGVRGDVRVRSFTADPEALFEYAPLLDETGSVLLAPKSYRPAKDHFIVTPEQPRQKEDWDALKGARLHIPRASLPDPDEDDFYIEDLVGLQALDLSGAGLGRVKTVLNHGAGDLLEIQPLQGGKPVLVPFTRQDVPSIDLQARQVIISDFQTWADTSDDDRPD